MTKKLYIHDDAPAEIKENIRLSQQCLDNMVGYQEKANNGTLTMKDLEMMVQKNHAIIDQFPKGNPAAAGLPASIEGKAGLLALAASRQAEVSSLTAKNPPVHQVGSIKDLYTLSQKSPEEIGDTFIAAAKRKAEEKKAAEVAEHVPLADSALPKPKKFKISKLDRNLYQQHLDKTAELLENCKLLYYNLHVNWPKIEGLEDQLWVHIEGLTEHGEPALEFLESYLTDQTDDEDAEEKKPAAAFLMASIYEDDSQSLERLLDLLRDNEELAPLVVQALKYSLNPNLNEELGKSPELEPPHVKTGIVETLQYRGEYKPDRFDRLRNSASPVVQAAVLKADVLEGRQTDSALVEELLQSEEKEILESIVFTSLLRTQKDTVWFCRKQINQEPEEVSHFPLLLSYAGDIRDFTLIKGGLEKENSKKSAIQALGILGLGDSVYTLLNQMKTEEWQIQTQIIESLELITGACLPLSPPDIKEGPEGKEYEVEVVTDWYEIWNNWWLENHSRFDETIRYRRGKRLNLGGCIDEMAYELGNHWSRQGSYYELRIRSGECVTHFEADWYVKDQQTAIQAWQDWWEKNQHKFDKSQWLFAGKTT